MTLTLKPETEQKLVNFATTRGMKPEEIAEELIARYFPAEEPEDAEMPLSAEDLASLKRGLADADAGRTLPLEESYQRGLAELTERMNASGL